MVAAMQDGLVGLTHTAPGMDKRSLNQVVADQAKQEGVMMVSFATTRVRIFHASTESVRRVAIRVGCIDQNRPLRVFLPTSNLPRQFAAQLSTLDTDE